MAPVPPPVPPRTVWTIGIQENGLQRKLMWDDYYNRIHIGPRLLNTCSTRPSPPLFPLPISPSITPSPPPPSSPPPPYTRRCRTASAMSKMGICRPEYMCMYDGLESSKFGGSSVGIPFPLLVVGFGCGGAVECGGAVGCGVRRWSVVRRWKEELDEWIGNPIPISVIQ